VSRRFTPEDINRFTSFGRVTVSPRGDLIAFVTAKPDRTRDRYDVRVWVTDLSGNPVYVSSGPSDSTPAWSPDGSTLLYQRVLDGGGAEVRLVNLNRGTDFAIARLQTPASSATWLTKEVVALTIPTKLYEEEPGVRVVRYWPVWFESSGFVYNVRNQVYLLDVRGGSVERLTRDEFSYNYVAADPLGRYLIASVARDTLRPYRTSLVVVRVDGSAEEVKLGYDLWIGPLAVSPTGRYLAFFGRDLGRGRGFAAHEELWLLNLEDLQLESVTRSLGLGVSRRVYYDLRGPASAEPRPVWDGDYVYFPISKGGRYSLYRYLTTGRTLGPVLDGDYVVWEYDVRDGVVAFVKVTATEPADLWVARVGGGATKVTRFNEVVREYRVSEPRYFRFRASDSAEVEGWVIEPVDRVEGGRYPAILWIHGGPKSKFGWSFMFEFQLYASNGYAVVYCNSRGSDGYSEEFADIREHYGERDYQDIVECLDHAIREFNFIDSDRVGITGISYGGYMVNWIVTQTDRFRAAVSQNGISMWEAEYLTTDIGPYFVPDQIGGDPWTNWEKLHAKSPLYYVDRVRTPLMIVHSLDDYRCWLDQAIALFTALKLRGREVELVLFESGGHTFGWSGRPSLREARLKHLLRWFNTYLKEGAARSEGS
jgi:acylaminoacyl-peptidase